MVVDNLDRIGAVACPNKTDAPLIVDADTVLSFPIIFQCFEAVGRRRPQIIERLRLIQHEQLAQGDLLNFARQFARHVGPPNFFGFSGCKSDNHAPV